MILNSDCILGLSTLPDNSVDAILTDPPYEIGMMDRKWDKTGIAFNVAMWKEALRVLRPGGYMLAFAATRNYHRMVCAVEDAGFNIKDSIMWVYGNGFPKSLNIGKVIDKLQCAERKIIDYKFRGAGGRSKDYRFDESFAITEPATLLAKIWDGWGTALKPAYEPICVAHKPIEEKNIAANVVLHGTGGININACRANGDRWPANLIHDGSADVPDFFKKCEWEPEDFIFYCAKASKKEKGANNTHPTVKPIALGRYLIRLICPPGGTAVDLFAGSGSFAVAAKLEGFKFIGFELDANTAAMANARFLAC